MMHGDSRVMVVVCLETTSLPAPCLSTSTSPRSREEPFICARVRRPAPSRRVIALTVLGSPCVISREGPVGRLRVLATANTPFPVPTCPALHSAGHIGLFVLSAWRPVASPLVTEGVICSSDAAREARSRSLGSFCLRPVAGAFPECLEERLHWVGTWTLWAKPRRAGVPGKDKGSGVLPGKADGEQQMTG